MAWCSDNEDANVTRDLLLSEVSTKTISGVVYREFFLNIIEPGTASFITLDQLEIYVSNTASLSSYVKVSNNDATGALTGATKIYDMDTVSNDNYVQLDYNLGSPASGFPSDMVFYLPNSLFGSNQYVYLYSQFGQIDNDINKHESNVGSEEWGVRAAAVPEPASVWLLSTGGLALAATLRRRRKQSVSA